MTPTEVQQVLASIRNRVAIIIRTNHMVGKGHIKEMIIMMIGSTEKARQTSNILIMKTTVHGNRKATVTTTTIITKIPPQNTIKNSRMVCGTMTSLLRNLS